MYITDYLRSFMGKSILILPLTAKFKVKWLNLVINPLFIYYEHLIKTDAPPL